MCAKGFKAKKAKTMEWFSDIRKAEVSEELIDLGFDRPGPILDQAEPCDDPKDPSVKASIFFEPIPRSDEDLALFLLIKEDSRNHWHIDQMHLYIQMESQRTQEGVLVFNRKFSLDPGPLPEFGSIMQIADAWIAVEKDKERCFSEYNLEKELTELGFSKNPELLKNRTREAGFTIFHFSESIEPNEGLKQKNVRFEFVVTPPEKNLPAVLWMIRGFLQTGASDELDLQCRAERGFYKFNDRLPHKAEMIKELLQMAKLQESPYAEVRRRFRIGQGRGEEVTQRSYIQGQLKL
jgi:hypothetical protein